jgi:hypothetical protein
VWSWTYCFSLNSCWSWNHLKNHLDEQILANTSCIGKFQSNSLSNDSTMKWNNRMPKINLFLIRLSPNRYEAICPEHFPRPWDTVMKEVDTVPLPKSYTLEGGCETVLSSVPMCLPKVTRVPNVLLTRAELANREGTPCSPQLRSSMTFLNYSHNK